MSNALRKIRRNQSEMAGVGRCNRYGSKTVRTFKSVQDKIRAFISSIGRNDSPLNHRGFIRTELQKWENEQEYQ